MFRAILTFDFIRPKSRSKCEISAHGGNELILDGAASKLEKRLKESKTPNEFAFRWPYILGITAAIVLPIGWLAYRGFLLSKGMSVLIFLFSVVVAVMFGFLFVERLLAWLFPYLTYPTDKRNITRRRVKWIFATIVLSIVSAGLFEVVRALLAPR